MAPKIQGKITVTVQLKQNVKKTPSQFPIFVVQDPVVDFKIIAPAAFRDQYRIDVDQAIGLFEHVIYHAAILFFFF